MGDCYRLVRRIQVFCKAYLDLYNHPCELGWSIDFNVSTRRLVSAAGSRSWRNSVTAWKRIHSSVLQLCSLYILRLIARNHLLTFVFIEALLHQLYLPLLRPLYSYYWKLGVWTEKINMLHDPNKYSFKAYLSSLWVYQGYRQFLSTPWKVPFKSYVPDDSLRPESRTCSRYAKFDQASSWRSHPPTHDKHTQEISLSDFLTIALWPTS